MGYESTVHMATFLAAATAIVVLWGLLVKATRPYAVAAAVPGIALAVLVGDASSGPSDFFGLFGIGSFVLGFPLAALLWFWVRYRKTKHGTVQ